jgi:rod shape-determining protein MreD
MNWTNTTLLVLAAIVLVFLESVINTPRRWLGVQIDFLPVLAIYAAMRCNLKTLALLSIAGGLAFDTLSRNPLGASILPLWLVGFAGYHCRELVLRDQWVAQAMIGGFACLAAALISLFLLSTLNLNRPEPSLEWTEGNPDLARPIELNPMPLGMRDVGPLAGWGSWWTLLLMTLGGALAGPVVFGLFDRLARLFNYAVATESTFRKDREIVRGRT